MRFVREVEEEALRRVRIPSFTTLLSRELYGESDPPLTDDDASRLRVEVWLAGEA
jgi:hypothetical protein